MRSAPCTARPALIARSIPSLDLLEGGADVVSQPAPDGRELHPTARPLEELGAEALFEPGDRLADPRRGDEQPLGGPPEVELLGEREEDLDLASLHRPLLRCR